MRDLLGDVEIAAGVDDGIEPALVRLNEGDGSNDEQDPERSEGGPPQDSLLSNAAYHLRYTRGEISEGLISLRPPQKTFV